MPSWMGYCLGVAKHQTRHPNADVRLGGIHISRRDARDTYDEMRRMDRYPDKSDRFEKITSMTAYGLEITWDPESPRFVWYGTMGV